MTQLAFTCAFLGWGFAAWAYIEWGKCLQLSKDAINALKEARTAYGKLFEDQEAVIAKEQSLVSEYIRKYGKLQ